MFQLADSLSTYLVVKYIYINIYHQPLDGSLHINGCSNFTPFSAETSHPVNIDRFEKRFLNLQTFFKPYKWQIMFEKSTKIFDWFEKGFLKDLCLKLSPNKSSIIIKRL